LRREWHFPNFLQDRPVEHKEAWLTSLIATSSVDTEAYLVVLRALAVSKRPDAALRAERWLVKLEANDRLSPTSECYQRVIEAWSAAVHENPELVVTRAERWLVNNLPSDDNLEPTLLPDTACFNAFLDACSKGRGLKKGSRGKDLVRSHAHKAQSTLQYMIDYRQTHGPGARISPDRDSFNYVVRAWTRCRRSLDVADRAMEVLRMMENYQNEVDPAIRPDSKSYAMFMDAISVVVKLKVKDCLNKAAAVQADPSKNGVNDIKLLKDTLKYMKEKSEDPSHRSIMPNTNTYNTLISAWANAAPLHADAPFQAERVLQQMIAFKDAGGASYEAAPDAVSYMLVMRAWVNSNKANKGKRVAWWLSKLWKDYDFEGRPSLCPTTATYNIAIRTWAELGQPLEAQALMTDLMKLAELGEHDKLQPNSESFSLLIRAWLAVAGKGSGQALKEAVHWLDILADGERKEVGLTTSVDLYYGILTASRNCVAHSPNLLDVAVETFDKLRESHHSLDCLHYSRLLNVALLALSGPENDEARDAFVVQLVKDCIEDGLISNAFLRGLADGPVFADGWTVQESARLTGELFPDWPLPPSWTRNLKQEGLIPRRSDLRRKEYRVERRRGYDLEVES
jgi:hypothetical protein